MKPRDLIARARAAHWPDGSENEGTVPDLCDALETALDGLAAQTAVLRIERKALSEALDRDATSETALRQRLVELDHLRAQVTDLQQDASRHEREARVERQRTAFRRACADECNARLDVIGIDDMNSLNAAADRREAAIERREAARRALEEFGEKP